LRALAPWVARSHYHNLWQTLARPSAADVLAEFRGYAGQVPEELRDWLMQDFALAGERLEAPPPPASRGPAPRAARARRPREPFSNSQYAAVWREKTAEARKYMADGDSQRQAAKRINVSPTTLGKWLERP
jgi:hypothetical protein